MCAFSRGPPCATEIKNPREIMHLSISRALTPGSASPLFPSVSLSPFHVRNFPQVRAVNPFVTLSRLVRAA